MSEVGFTPNSEQLAWMRDQLAEQFPHLDVTVIWREGAFHVEALPR